jgi:glycosyltransferase involved in cell wall biosynthesis
MLSATNFIPRFAATIAKRARNWDHIIAHWLVPSALAARIARKPMTAIAHGGDVHTLRRFGLLKPTLRALRGAKLVFVSDELRRLAGVDGIVQPMGVDLAHFAALGRAPTTPPTVLFVGRLVPIKGVDTLIEAMAHLPRAWRLVIAGDGPERRALEARARKTNATFLGAVSTGQRDRLLREASVVVVPSRTVEGRTEGCPTIAIEALAAGVPVVATIGRASEIVRSDEPAELARGIERAMGRTNTAALVRDLDWCEVADRLLRNE